MWVARHGWMYQFCLKRKLSRLQHTQISFSAFWRLATLFVLTFVDTIDEIDRRVGGTSRP